jgi:trans-2,3-dihydro-3-hydroxyanthranilate isomerase
MPPVRIPFRVVDVFTDRPLAGNQLCVIPDPVELNASAMQAIAAEIGFSETTFVTDAGGHRYAMRIFTPARELPFAGHPTLGTAFVMVSEGRVTAPVVQSVIAGEIEVEVDVETGFARMHQLPPGFGSFPEDLDVVAAAGGLAARDLHPELRPRVVSTGLPVLIVPLRDPEGVIRAVPRPEVLGPLLDETGTDTFYLFAATDERQAKARMFGVGVGVAEDAATGSAAGPLGAYLVERGAMTPGLITVSQGAEIGRPSTLFVDVESHADGWRVHVGGGVAKVAQGEFDLPL